MTIQLDARRVEVLEVCENDDPAQLARQFCDKFGLPLKIVPTIVESIKKNLSSAVQEKRKMNSYVRSPASPTALAEPEAVLPQALSDPRRFQLLEENQQPGAAGTRSPSISWQTKSEAA